MGSETGGEEKEDSLQVREAGVQQGPCSNPGARRHSRSRAGERRPPPTLVSKFDKGHYLHNSLREGNARLKNVNGQIASREEHIRKDGPGAGEMDGLVCPARGRKRALEAEGAT